MSADELIEPSDESVEDLEVPEEESEDVRGGGPALDIDMQVDG